MLVDLVLWLHASTGNGIFLALMGVLTLALCLFAIPRTTDLMVNSSAGLAGKYFGDKTRTMVINASTNNPELFSMITSLAILRIGGVANPLGSNFANIYLMFLVAPLFVILRDVFRGRKADAASLLNLAKKEKGLVTWHIVASIAMFATSTFAYYSLTGQMAIGGGDAPPVEPTLQRMLITLAVCAAAIVGFLFFYRRLQSKRPELFDDIASEDHTESWARFIFGTAGLLASCYVMNAVFVACSTLYGSALQVVLGTAVFAGLHYFVGALVTSLPELKIAIDNYSRRTSPDLNTAMASASVSNMVNMAIAAFGTGIIAVLVWLGYTLLP